MNIRRIHTTCNHVEVVSNHIQQGRQSPSTGFWILLKLLAAAVLCFHAVHLHQQSSHRASSDREDNDTVMETLSSASSLLSSTTTTTASRSSHRRLSEKEDRAENDGLSLPSEARGSPYKKYLEKLFANLHERQKLFTETPANEIKYWFEYNEPLQRYFYRFSRSRGKADYFEGRDDSGVVSARFIQGPGGNKEYQEFFTDSPQTEIHQRLLQNCIAMGSLKTSNGWNPFVSKTKVIAERCRILFAINTVGAGRGTTILWETNPPVTRAEGPPAWTSEQETAATHLQRNLEEINTMCRSGLIAARVQVLVCEPISPKWVDWMDSLLVDCGGKPQEQNDEQSDSSKLQERPSPVQLVVTANAATADTCHDLKSGFMEKRMQDLVLATPLRDTRKSAVDATEKSTHPDLVSSDPFDLYVAMKWSSLVTIRAVHAFLQASADLAAAASSLPPVVQEVVPNGPSSRFLIPSFVRVSYVSEENSKVAKWRMHGDFFHPAAWEICKDSYDMTWIPRSVAGKGGVTPTDKGQWWLYFHELQMPTNPEVYANEVTPTVVQGGSNFIWMVTERQRQEVVKGIVCRASKKDDECTELPQAVIPLGDLQSFLINFTPNTALGKQHVHDRRPGYSRLEERLRDRERVKKRKQLHDQDDIEKALFDYTIYPAALFHKDATIKAVRARDLALSGKEVSGGEVVGPRTCKSSYYDVTITKPRGPLLGWCQAIARKGLCTLYADFFRTTNTCQEACGFAMDWTSVDDEAVAEA